jgi:hypothetical protein
MKAKPNTTIVPAIPAPTHPCVRITVCLPFGLGYQESKGGASNRIGLGGESRGISGKIPVSRDILPSGLPEWHGDAGGCD